MTTHDTDIDTDSDAQATAPGVEGVRTEAADDVAGHSLLQAEFAREVATRQSKESADWYRGEQARKTRRSRAASTAGSAAERRGAPAGTTGLMRLLSVLSGRSRLGRMPVDHARRV
jgi:hypothetical protein